MNRLWDRVEKTASGCWVFGGARDRKGYGRIGFRGTNWHAARVAWTLTYGEIPPRTMVLHHCDNPPCIRPEHLFLGTAQDNSDDAWQKGRATISAMVQASVKKRREKRICKHGHPLEGVNLYVNAKGERGCKICRSVARRRYECRRRVTSAPSSTTRRPRP
jgi:hypothetical protein